MDSLSHHPRIGLSSLLPATVPTGRGPDKRMPSRKWQQAGALPAEGSAGVGHL